MRLERKDSELEELDCFQVLRDAEWLCEDICSLLRSGNVFEFNKAGSMKSMNIVITCVDVLCARMINIVFDMFESGF